MRCANSRRIAKPGRRRNGLPSNGDWGFKDAIFDQAFGKAEQQLEDLPQQIQKRIARWLALLEENPYRRPSCQLEGYPELRRIHASKDYVIVYSVLKEEVVVLIVRVAHRSEVYRSL
jgi:mRNA interferase RelE/StbE